MHRSLNSTQIFSKNYSKPKLHSRIKISNSVLHSQSSKSRPASKSSLHKIVRKESLMNSHLHQELIRKNKKLNIMIKSLHSFAVGLEDLDWIINQAESIIKDFIQKIDGTSRTPHRIQIENIYSELIKLIQRFSSMQKEHIRLIQIDNKNCFTLTQNRNFSNFVHGDTIGSFKYTDFDSMENNEENGMPTDFSKIKLPSIIKESAPMENINSSCYDNEAKFRKNQHNQCEATIEILKDEIERYKNDKQLLKENYEEKIKIITTKIQSQMVEWQAYKKYASATIHKCKNHLQDIKWSGGQSQQIQRLLDDLFGWQNTINGQMLEDNNEITLHSKKKAYLEELLDLEWKVKQNKAELQKINTFRSRTNSKMQLKSTEELNNQVLKMLFLQASAIEHLI